MPNVINDKKKYFVKPLFVLSLIAGAVFSINKALYVSGATFGYTMNLLCIANIVKIIYKYKCFEKIMGGNLL